MLVFKVSETAISAYVRTDRKVRRCRHLGPFEIALKAVTTAGINRWTQSEDTRDQALEQYELEAGDWAMTVVRLRGD